LKGYDYSQSGTYFVTIVTQGHKCLFGKIIDIEMHLNNLGKIAQNFCLEIPKHFPGIEVEPFIVMPNQIHGGITILEDQCRSTIYRAPTNELELNDIARYILTNPESWVHDPEFIQ
jgi:REP element-mobilizing transposase RayT